MVFEDTFILGMSKYSEKLIGLDFSPRLICEPEDCKIWYEYCTEHNMKFLKDSYGSLVNKDFDKYFKVIDDDKIYDKLTESMFEEIPNQFLDHKNLIQSRFDKSVYILTCSPYHILHDKDIRMLQECKYSTYIINPLLLNYYGFMTPVNRHPLWEMNYAFTNASEEQMYEISMDMKDTVRFAFELLVEGKH